MSDLLPDASAIAALLKRHGHTIAVAELSAGGLVAASLLGVGGASAYFIGGVVVYTRHARHALLGIPDEALAGFRAATEPYALLLARTVRERLGTTWGLAETGATGPAGNRYGDAAGHACVAIAGPVERTMTLETGSADRAANMRAFTEAALRLLEDALDEAAT